MVDSSLGHKAMQAKQPPADPQKDEISPGDAMWSVSVVFQTNDTQRSTALDLYPGRMRGQQSGASHLSIQSHELVLVHALYSG